MVQSYAQAAASSPLDGADRVYVAKGGAQRPLPGVGEGGQGVEAAGGREIGGGQPGPPDASPGQCGPESGCAADTWEAEDGLSGSSGFLFFNREARGACVADANPRAYMYINPRTVTGENAPIAFMKNISLS